eukprot:COSAG02_NODE_50732_length_318_cov_1.392694_1_plen_49_part_01
MKQNVLLPISSLTQPSAGVSLTIAAPGSSQKSPQKALRIYASAAFSPGL